jgi:glutamine amidotransferase
MSKLRLVVIDYGAGNLRSVAKALESLGASPSVSASPGDVARAEVLVLPGQGACDSAMAALEQRHLTETLKEAIGRGTPFLGVCLGLQLLFDTSEEGDVACLGLVPGTVRRLPPGRKVPHMGWNTVHVEREHPIFAGVPQDTHFYFVHSYYVDPAQDESVLARTSYGTDFCSAAARGNLVATQFHPEKSGAWGLKLYENFLWFAEQNVPTTVSSTPMPGR